MDLCIPDELPDTPPSASTSSSTSSSHSCTSSTSTSSTSTGNTLHSCRPARHLQSSHTIPPPSDHSGHDASILDLSQPDGIAMVKRMFLHLSPSQKDLFLLELLNCCDNQLLAFLHTLIAPKLKIDFLKQLPTELSLRVLSFIDDPVTLARASCVSTYWHSLLKDESIWRALCVKYRYLQSPFFTPAVSCRDYFRRKYTIDTAWSQGGNVSVYRNSIGPALVTGLQMQEPLVVVSCDNNQIEVFDTTTGKHIRSLTGHEGGVWALQFIKVREGEYLLVTGGCDRVVRVWELPSGNLRHALRGHSSTIRCLKIRDEKLAVTGSRDSSLRIWDIEHGTLRHLCLGHQHSVRCMDIHGNKVASGSYDTTARLWDLETGECLHTFLGHHLQIYAIVFDGTRVVTGSLDSNIRVWSAETGQCLATLHGHTSLVGQLQLLPCLPSLLVSGGSDGCLRVWDLDRYECKHRISAHDNTITCLQFDQKRIMSGGSDGRVKLWDLETGRLIRTFSPPARTVWKLQFHDTKAVIVKQHSGTDLAQTIIELHDFDLDH